MVEAVYKNKGKLKNYIINRRFAYFELKDYKWLLAFVLIGAIILGNLYFFEGEITGSIVSV